MEFHPSPGKLDVLDSKEYRLKEDDKIRSLFIPVEWTDYEIKGDSENIDLSFSERQRQSVYDKNLRYFKMKFEELIANDIEIEGKKPFKKCSLRMITSVLILKSRRRRKKPIC